jgi:hypothetical protein
MGRLRWFAFGAAVCLLLASGAAWAQSQATTGVIEGLIEDSEGSSLPGVAVTATNVATNFQRVVTTDGNGRFRAVLMPLGPYRVTAELESFAPLVREGIQLTLGSEVFLELTMSLAAVDESILVTAEAPLIESTRTESTIRIDRASVEGLPNNGRDFLEFTRLTPGVTIVQGPDGEELSITGQKGINNNVSIDGADFNNPFFGEQRGGQRPAFTFNIDAIQEVLVVPDGAPAEFGRSSGGFVNVVTKSGTNDLTGTAHLFFKNDSLSDDRQLRDGSSEDVSFDQNQVGFTLGGPLRADKVFFFVAADRQRADETKQNDPGRIAPDVVAFLAAQGLAGENGPISRTDDADAYLAKVDWVASGNHLVTGRWAYHYSEQENGTFDVDSWGVSANGIETDWANTTALSVISTLSPNVLNEFRGQFSKEYRPRPYGGPDVPGQSRPFPDTAFDFGGGYRVGMPFFLPVEYNDERVQLNDNISLLRGNHSFKAGFEFNDTRSSQTFIGFANGRYIFSSFQGFQNYVNFGPQYVECSDGSSSTAGVCPAGSNVVGPLLLFLQQAGVGDTTAEEAGTQTIDQKEPALFVQDQWQPRADLTVELGLRWEELDMPEPVTPADEVFFSDFIGKTVTNSVGTFEFPSDGNIPDNDSLQPRLALAWTPLENENAVFRFNAGMYAARVPALSVASSRSTNGSLGQTLFRASFFNEFGVTPPAWPNLIPQDQIGDPDHPDVFVFHKDFQLPETVSTALSWEQELIPSWAFLFKFNYAATNHLTRFVNRNQATLGSPWSTGLGPTGTNGIGALTSVESTAKSRYHAFTVGVNKRLSKNYQLQAYYTWSKDESDDDNERDPFTLRYANFFALDKEFSLSDRHQRHRFNGWVLWNAPKGIDINARVTYLDNQPLDIRPDGQPVSAFPPTERCIPAPAAAGDPCDPSADVFRRNQGEKDNEFFTIDLRLTKEFQVGDYTVQPIIDIFNLTNSDNFLVPQVTNLIFNFDGTVRSGAGEPREIQVGVRILR